ncbi:MAG TPA: FYDLN acid domain-containing protein [Thermoanaerobaculia bacterium]|nr:FYDLN acid domain-containing protein [Thermoanaerobaculia bacterium]
MPELKLGTKFECFNCSTKFYDLGKGDAICPKCGADQKNALKTEAPAASQASRRKRKVEVAKPVEVEEEEPIEVLPDDEIEAPEIDADAEVGEAEADDED